MTELLTDPRNDAAGAFEPLLTITAVGFEYYAEWMQFIACLQLQTDPRWVCQLINDGPDDRARGLVELLTGHDRRFTWGETSHRYNDWGHSLRAIGLERATTPYWCTQNADNYLTPAFVELILAEFATVRASARGDIPSDVVLFDCVHNYPNVNARRDPPYSVLDVSLRRNRCDAGTIALRTDLAKQVGWQSVDENSDGDFVEDIRRANPIVWKIPNVLMVHN